MKKINFFKKTYLAYLFGFFFLFNSCKQHDDLEGNSLFKYDKTEIVKQNKTIIVKTDNIGNDFNEIVLFMYDNVEVINGFIKSKEDSNLWFVPFNKFEKTILLYSNTKRIDPDITISCESCVGTCEVSGTSSGGTTKYKCKGGCLNGGDCDMTVTIKYLSRNKIVKIPIRTSGIIVSSNNLIFNNIKY